MERKIWLIPACSTWAQILRREAQNDNEGIRVLMCSCEVILILVLKGHVKKERIVEINIYILC